MMSTIGWNDFRSSPVSTPRPWQPLFIAMLIVISLVSLLAFVAKASPPTRPRPVPDPLFIAPESRSECPPPGFVIDATVVRVIDGDTVVVRSSVEYQIRLLDCWAPESRTKDLQEKRRGLAAKARMQELASEKPCRVFLPGADSLADMMTLGRILGRVWLLEEGSPATMDLSTIMVCEGHATTTKAEASP
jgi:endonuclease YncB( thermonuclease family)